MKTDTTSSLLMPAMATPVFSCQPGCDERAALLAGAVGSTVVASLAQCPKDQYVLMVSDDGLRLAMAGGKGGDIIADFGAGAVAHRRLHGGGKGQMIAKAVGFGKGVTPSVLDATAGMGKDAFVLATLGCQMSLYERSPIVAQLLSDGLQRAAEFGDGELQQIVGRMQLHHGDAIEVMAAATSPLADVIYLDPMFPASKKSAAVKKEMQAFQQVVGKDMDGEALLAAAINAAGYRVAVKRPRKGEPLPGVKPGFQLMGKSSRYDIYPLKAFK
ncbi:Ribosomal RNA small subunit methyltransferase J [Sinobacterium norvegicum]|uniref:Ribosomal RNA small subunit methyltransferase J n=1 Tax=Sinobacterium norvegicum TaxID=1641715 RepID=A0ABN8ELT9_9GAMM|nr:class I SAM-dependent methyltransferase [Sinobacterium norvegicum]CAH0993361.1 Ribosomal RNA small subunit methyltransferase J [Sinobacterium norvegicum]